MSFNAKKQSSDKLSALASKAMKGGFLTQGEIKSLAASVLSQDEVKGRRGSARHNKSIPEIFWDIVEELKTRSGPMDPINSFTHPLNSITHPLRSITHPLNSITHPLNSIMNPNKGFASARALQELLDKYVR